jgi:hypothetical protein
MTLQELFDAASAQPHFVIIYFIALPLVAAIMWWIAKDHGIESPWKYIYTALVYLACIPGILAFTFDIYMFIFQRGNILSTDINLQVLPILSMALTLWLIRKNIDFQEIPWFDNISRMITIIFSVLILMFLIDKIHIYSFTYVPLWQLLGIFVALILIVRYAWSRMF